MLCLFQILFAQLQSVITMFKLQLVNLGLFEADRLLTRFLDCLLGLAQAILRVDLGLPP
jgi:hypothetical protein